MSISTGRTVFTFLNTIGTPDLSRADVMRVRGHVTRMNFASRRRRIAQARSVSSQNHTRNEEQAIIVPKQPPPNAPPADLLRQLATPPKDKRQYTELFSSYWSFVFLYGVKETPAVPTRRPGSTSSRRMPHWPSPLVATGIRSWSPDLGCQEEAAVHAYKAVNLVIRRIRTETAHTDAVIGAVFHMAIGERLMHNDLAWEIHLGGLAELIVVRLARGQVHLPSMLANFLI
ncbi:hypothetical protein B0H66DRAFT_530836 [Apodospora peruviana]|uniref:Uncharacterized protein n=1 Tax=Apodospora peruviana TaxID=516989 RepID=A0AAE0IKI6_9PEZI|nr:hypothetical protein B0H66DRAFT_530836 [Apodospora peruviana]